jgi:hypothetical protein
MSVVARYLWLLAAFAADAAVFRLTGSPVSAAIAVLLTLMLVFPFLLRS